MSKEGSTEAPIRHPVNFNHPDFLDPKKLDDEMRRVFDICHGCRRCFNLCDSFPKLFDMIDESKDEDVESLKSDEGIGRETVFHHLDGVVGINTEVVDAGPQQLGQQSPDTGAMHFNAHKLHGGVCVGHLQQTVAHPKAHFDDAAPGETKGRIPIQWPALEVKAKPRKTLLPATRLCRRHSSGTHHEAAYSICERALGGSHGKSLKELVAL